MGKNEEEKSATCKIKQKHILCENLGTTNPLEQHCNSSQVSELGPMLHFTFDCTKLTVLRLQLGSGNDKHLFAYFHKLCSVEQIS